MHPLDYDSVLKKKARKSGPPHSDGIKELADQNSAATFDY